MNLFQYAGLSVVLIFLGAGLAAWLTKEYRKQILQDILSLSGAFLFGIIILELFPVVFRSHDHMIGVMILLGFFVQIGIDVLTGGIEHGHIHVHDMKHRQGALIGLFGGLAVHAIFDGLPFIGITTSESHLHGVYSGILIHKIAEGFTLLLLLQLLEVSRSKSFVLIFLFSILTPLGMVAMQKTPALREYLNYVLAFAAGSLLHVAITILFESENIHHHGIAWRKLGWIILGLGLALLIAFLH